ncbi:MAG: esterase/lipase family protein [Promethearchaeota archaeon]
MEQLKEKFQKVAGFSKIKCSHFRDTLKKKRKPTELALRKVVPEYPLILLHGYWNAPIVWKKFVMFFEANGYVKDTNLFLFDGRGDKKTPANIDIQINAKKLEALVQQVLTSTGKTKVNLVAHSMGGLISRWYIEQLGGNDKVHKLIMLGTPNHGSAYLPLLTRIVGYIDDKLETVEENKWKFDQMKGQNALHKTIHKVKDKYKEKMVSPKSNNIGEDTSVKLTWRSFDKKTEEEMNEHIQEVTAENNIDHLGIAAIQMDPGSEFLTTLGYKGLSNYYLVTGIKGLPAGLKGWLPEGDNDGVVHADSVDLTEVPVSHKVTFKVNHYQLFWKVVSFNQIMNFLVL